MVTRSWSLLLLLSLLKVANSVSNSNDEIYILKSEVNTLRAELEAFKLESERPNNLLENEEVLLHWLKRNVMDIRKDLIDEERQRGEDSRRSLGVEERMKGKMERGLEELRARVTEMQLEQETLRSLGEEIKSNIHFYNRIQSSDNSIMDPNIIHIRTKKQMSREFKKMYGRINEFFRRISEVEMSQATLKIRVRDCNTHSNDLINEMERNFSQQIQGLQNVSLSTFATIKSVEEELSQKIQQSDREKSSERNDNKVIQGIISRQHDLETSIGELVRKFNFLLDAKKFKEEEEANKNDLKDTEPQSTR
ncbi:uncharacterized protein [Lepeophtheirus salmonis]|uniref:uncharacterized protein n=1 Tax=Lepeophtheirus salmonis TaxID=72036 RepID=UPI001AE33E64|nr:early endosome antigen 1-like isoform X1 [Lepeophtheirus salmonis]